MYLAPLTCVCLLHDSGVTPTPCCEEMAQVGKLIERLPLPIVPPNLKIGHEIGSGAWGMVHEGELDGKPVAVKKIHRVLKDADHGDNAVRTFFEECERLKTISHPHVISE